MVMYCVVPQCSTRFRRGVRFHRFPSDESLRKQWIRAIKCEKEPNRGARICSDHFKETDYIMAQYSPMQILRLGTIPSVNLPKTQYGELKNNSSLSMESGECSSASRSVDENEEYPETEFLTLDANDDKPKNNSMLLTSTEERSSASKNFDDNEEYPETEFLTLDADDEHEQKSYRFDNTGELSSASSENEEYLETEVITKEFVEETQQSTTSMNSDTISISDTLNNKTFETKAVQTNRIITLNTEMLFNNMSDEDFKNFTGFEKNSFLYLYRDIKTFSTSYDSYMNSMNQLVLTLIKYKHALDFRFIEKIYRIHRTIASNIISLWTEIMYKYFKQINFWSLSCVESPQHTAIIDFTEILTEHSTSDPLINQHLFSDYKNHNTFKYLVAADENGLIMFCSNVYGGSKSNRFIMEHSKFIDLLKSGDILLADRDFDVSNLLEKKGVTLNMPSLNTKPQVERVINLTRKNGILCDIIPSSLWPQINEIVYNCNMLHNFEDFCKMKH